MADEKPPTAELQPRERAPVQVGIRPTTIESAHRLAQFLAASEMVPKYFRGKPEEIIAAIQLGAEIGLLPMQALQSIAVINGRPSVYGDGLLALIMRSPLYQDHDEYFLVDDKRADRVTADDLAKPTTTAVCSFVRRNKGLPTTRTFSVAQAKRAQLLGKPGPWQEYPDRMLQMRARTFAARDAFPDLLRGITSAEESSDFAKTDPPAAPPTVRRMSERVVDPEILEPDNAEGNSYADGFKSRGDD